MENAERNVDCGGLAREVSEGGHFYLCHLCGILN